jgi:molecular chaperone GrpE
MTKKVVDDQESCGENPEDNLTNQFTEEAPLEGELSQGESSRESGAVNLRISELEAELKRQREQSDRYRDELLRRAADFENFRRQKEREAMMTSSRVLENIIGELLPVVDDIKRILQHAPLNSESSPEARISLEGVELVMKNLEKWLAAKGVKAIESKGMKLDVNFHEAISQIDHPEAESDTIIDEYQTGYVLGERVIRHAKVIVAR